MSEEVRDHVFLVVSSPRHLFPSIFLLCTCNLAIFVTQNLIVFRPLLFPSILHLRTCSLAIFVTQNLTVYSPSFFSCFFLKIHDNIALTKIQKKMLIVPPCKGIFHNERECLWNFFEVYEEISFHLSPPRAPLRH